MYVKTLNLERIHLQNFINIHSYVVCFKKYVISIHCIITKTISTCVHPSIRTKLVDSSPSFLKMVPLSRNSYRIFHTWKYFNKAYQNFHDNNQRCIVLVWRPQSDSYFIPMMQNIEVKRDKILNAICMPHWNPWFVSAQFVSIKCDIKVP